VRFCAFTYEVVGAIATNIVAIWRWVAVQWVRCAAQPCTWWCLCCNKWGCWIGLIIVGILVTIILVIFLILSIIFVLVCWAVCLIIVFLTAIGRLPVPNCVAPNPAPGPAPPPQVPPTVTITQPASQASFPDGDTIPIVFTATAVDADGSPLSGAAVRWQEFLGTVPNTWRELGQGTQISVTLPHRPIDAAANRPSGYDITVRATGTNGLTASDSVSIMVGRVRIG
jgi:hypothetical protein